MFFFLLKWVLVLALLVASVLFLANGLGAEIALVKYKELEAHGVPIGIMLLAAGVALAVLWKITTTTTTIEHTYSETFADGSSFESTKETKITTTLNPPGR